jgi:hypothetical protein
MVENTAFCDCGLEAPVELLERDAQGFLICPACGSRGLFVLQIGWQDDGPPEVAD